MGVRLFVGNLDYSVSEADLREHFAPVGQPSQVALPVDRETGRPRGFAFVEFSDRAVAEEVIRRFHGATLKGRALAISEARAREERPFSPRPPFGGGSPGGPPPAGGAGGFAPRPPRPPFGGGGGGGGSMDGPPSGDRPRTRGPAKAKPRQQERGPKGPIKERPGARILDIDDTEDSGSGSAEVDFDNFATSRPDEQDDDE